MNKLFSFLVLYMGSKQLYWTQSAPTPYGTDDDIVQDQYEQKTSMTALSSSCVKQKIHYREMFI